MKEQKGKHLTSDERTEIQECLAKGMTFKVIGKRIGKDQTTISKEVKRHIKVHTNKSTVRLQRVPKQKPQLLSLSEANLRSRICSK